MERELFALLIETIDALPRARRRAPKARDTDRDIALVWLWAVPHDRPIDWACRRENWPWHDRERALPSGSTMSRRLRDPAIEALALAVLDALRVPVETKHKDDAPVHIIDGKPPTVSGNSADRHAGVLAPRRWIAGKRIIAALHRSVHGPEGGGERRRDAKGPSPRGQ